MKLLTDEEICEWIEWSHYALQGIEWSTPEGENFLRTPDFSTEQPWFDYVVPTLDKKGNDIEIKINTGSLIWRVYFYPIDGVYSIKACDSKLPDAFRAALTKLVQENK